MPFIEWDSLGSFGGSIERIHLKDSLGESIRSLAALTRTETNKQRELLVKSIKQRATYKRVITDEQEF